MDMKTHLVRGEWNFGSPMRCLMNTCRIGEECQPWTSEPDPEPLFDTGSVAVVSNGR